MLMHNEANLSRPVHFISVVDPGGLVGVNPPQRSLLLVGLKIPTDLFEDLGVFQ